MLSDNPYAAPESPPEVITPPDIDVSPFSRKQLLIGWLVTSAAQLIATAFTISLVQVEWLPGIGTAHVHLAVTTVAIIVLTVFLRRRFRFWKSMLYGQILNASQWAVFVAMIVILTTFDFTPIQPTTFDYQVFFITWLIVAVVVSVTCLAWRRTKRAAVSETTAAFSSSADLQQ
ncbi:MAG: hypothetical protein R3C49_14150 [Planctomycetaceae bacterium]